MHRKKDAIHSDECQDKVNLAKTFVHHLAEHLREPVIGSSKHTENGCDAHNQVEVADDEIRIVKEQVYRCLTQENSAQTTRYKQRDESKRKQHGHLEANLAAP